MKRFLASLCLAAMFTSVARSEPNQPAVETPKGPYTADWESLGKYNEAPEWFKDAKFGIYVHWGVLSVPEFGNDWYPRNMHLEGSREYQHHVETYGHPSKFGYHDFVPMFKAENFDANQWAGLFKKAGARFAGMVAEHHDGFSMWASSVNPWNAKDMGPHRDLVGELEKAIHGQGMRFITTFHMERNLQKHANEPGGKNDESYFPYVIGMPTSSTDPKLRILYGNIPPEQFYANWKAKLYEVIDNYRPDVIWFDLLLNLTPEKYRQEFVAYYFNRANEWGREVVITQKGKQDLPDEVSIRDLEKGRMNEITPYIWLADETISTGSWSYTKDLEIKSPDEVLHVLIDIVSKNGVMLFNISPRASGEIPQNQQALLLKLGDWLGKFGEAIYGTRPWVVYGEGPARLEKGGNFLPRVKYTPDDIRYTTKGNVIYAIALGWPGENKKMLLKSFAKERLKGNLDIVDVSMLGSPEKIQWTRQDEGLTVTTPKEKVDDMAVVFRIETTVKAVER
jgi:alpha-L-fucosidase